MILAIPTDTCYGFACHILDELSFNLIYKLKGRDFGKPFSVVVKNFDALVDIISITDSQLDFLKNYKYPFTVIGNRNDNFLLPDFLDKSTYSKIAVRVADLCLQKDISDKLVFPSFLTSANISGNEEIYNSQDISSLIKEHDVIVFEGLINKKPASDIFSFVGDTIKLDYRRKNY